MAAGEDESRHPGYVAQIAHGDTFHNDWHPDLKADCVLAPPFNDSDWRREQLKDDKCRVYGNAKCLDADEF